MFSHRNETRRPEYKLVANIVVAAPDIHMRVLFTRSARAITQTSKVASATSPEGPDTILQPGFATTKSPKGS